MCGHHGPSARGLILTLFTAAFLGLGDFAEDEPVRFFLLTRNNSSSSHEMSVNGLHFDNRNFRPKYPTKISVHGFEGSAFGPQMQSVQEEYLKKGRINVIAMDWSSFAAGTSELDYPTAVQNVAYVGKCLAELINKLRDYGATDIHVVAHSLGAHVAAAAAENLKPYNVSRITGLDPAGPSG